MADKPDLELIRPDSGDLFTIADFIEICLEEGFINYDGMGNWATATEVEKGGHEKWIYPSQIKKNQIKAPEWATHVLWYNR